MTTIRTLSMDAIDNPPYALRDVTETLTEITQGSNLVRTLNGSLADWSNPAFQKYALSIDANDQQAPGIDGKWKGQLVTVDCVTELSYRTSGGSASKTVVPGSSRVDGDFTFYRPRLSMMVVDFSVKSVEIDGTVGWTMDLEER